MLGETLKRLRGIYGLTAKEASDRLGISASYLSEIEHGKKEPPLQLLQSYADLFGVRLSSLIRFSESYDCEEKSGRGQQFITDMMRRLIERYSEDRT